jgi:hypothetical protein
MRMEGGGVLRRREERGTDPVDDEEKLRVQRRPPAASLAEGGIEGGRLARMTVAFAGRNDNGRYEVNAESSHPKNLRP